MKLYIVCIGYGIWFIRARDPKEAERIARIGGISPSGEEVMGANEYGEENTSAIIDQYELDGDSAVLDGRYS